MATHLLERKDKVGLVRIFLRIFDVGQAQVEHLLAVLPPENHLVTSHLQFARVAPFHVNLYPGQLCAQSFVAILFQSRASVHASVDALQTNRND